MRQKKNSLDIFYVLVFCVCAFAFTAEARAAGVSLTASPTAQTVTVGQTATYTIKINRDNYADKVTLSATALPAGVSASFNPNVTTATSSTLKLQTSATTPIGIFNINVKATANGVSIAPIIVKLTTQPVPSISVTVTPPSQFIVAGQSTYYDIAVNRFNYDGKLTFSVQNLPDGVTALFEPESTYGNSSRMYLYSGGVPFLWKDYGMLVRANNPYDGIDKLVPVQVRVNFGINWAAQFAAPNNQNEDIATDVTYDAAGNVYVTGYSFVSAINDTDSWVAKFDAAGNQLWLSLISGMNGDRATDVFVDAAGNVYAAGSLSAQSYDIFIAKFDAGGAQTLPVSFFGTVNDEGQSGMQFGVDAVGNTTLTAVTRVRISNLLIPRDVQNVPATIGTFDVTRFTFDANFIRTNTTLVVDASGEPKDLAVGGDGSLYVLGEDHTQMSPDPRLLIVTSQVEKFNPANGQSLYRSLPILPSSGNAFKANRLKVDAGGNVFAVGTKLRREIDVSLNYSNTWMVKLNTSGARAWMIESFRTANPTEISALDIDASGNIICAGNTWESLRGRNPNPGGPGIMSARTDAWFGKFSGADGGQIFLSQFNVLDHDGFNAVKVGTGSAIHLAGYSLNFRANLGFRDALLVQCSANLFCGFLQ